jgi:hypothetical protein
MSGFQNVRFAKGFKTGSIETGLFATRRFENRTLCKLDFFKTDVLKSDVKKPDVLWVYLELSFYSLYRYASER